MVFLMRNDARRQAYNVVYHEDTEGNEGLKEEVDRLRRCCFYLSSTS
jgi:hypothetical protein